MKTVVYLLLTLCVSLSIATAQPVPRENVAGQRELAADPRENAAGQRTLRPSVGAPGQPPPTTEGREDAAPEGPSATPKKASPAKQPQIAAPSPIEGLLLAFYLALAATALTVFVRARTSTELLARPPLGCNPCMSFWTTLVVIGAWYLAVGPAASALSKPLVLWFVTTWLVSAGMTWLILERGPRET